MVTIKVQVGSHRLLSLECKASLSSGPGFSEVSDLPAFSFLNPVKYLLGRVRLLGSTCVLICVVDMLTDC